MEVVTISGLDGSGKSTQVERLSRHFGDQGKRVYYFHSVQFSIANRLARRASRGSARAAAGDMPGVTRAGRGGIALRKLFLRIDIVRFRALLRRLERQGYDVVLSDRHFYDNLVNIAYLARTRHIMRLTPPRPTSGFYLRVDPARIMSRERAPEQGLEYLRAKYELYDDVTVAFGLTVIDGSGDPDEVAKTIIASIASR